MRAHAGTFEGGTTPVAPRTTSKFTATERTSTGSCTRTPPYAAGFAAVIKPILCCLIATGDYFGPSIPCAGFALIGSEAIVRQVVAHIGSSKAVSLKQHNVLAIGETATAAVKATVMEEDVAEAV